MKVLDFFCEYSYLIYFPDISKWNASNINSIQSLFENCSSIIYLPNI